MVFVKLLLGRRRSQLTADDLAALERAVIETPSLSPRTTLIRQGELVTASTYLIDGYMCRYMDDHRGERQLVALHVPGDFVDLHGYPLKWLDHDLATLTPCRVARIPAARIDDIVRERPNLTRLLWFSTLLDAAMHREWIFRLGRLQAIKRLGHFFCEVEARLAAVGLSDGGRFTLPLTQADLGEACGLTPVHINRMIRGLRERGLLTMQGNVVTINDKPALYALCEFDPSYLYLDDFAAEH